MFTHKDLKKLKKVIEWAKENEVYDKVIRVCQCIYPLDFAPDDMEEYVFEDEYDEFEDDDFYDDEDVYYDSYETYEEIMTIIYGEDFFE